MAIENIPIDSGTGPKIAVDSVGTVSYQVVKVMQANDGATASLGGPWIVTNTGTAVISVAGTPTVTGTVSVGNIATITTLLGTVAISGTATALPSGTQDVSVKNVLSASAVTIASITTGTLNVVNVLSASGVTVATVSTLLGTVAVSGSVSPVVGVVGHGRSTVAADGVATALTGAGVVCKKVHLKALATNTGAVMVGTSGVSLSDTGSGYPLLQAESVSIVVNSVGNLFINAANSKDGVSYVYEI